MNNDSKRVQEFSHIGRGRGGVVSEISVSSQSGNLTPPHFACKTPLNKGPVFCVKSLFESPPPKKNVSEAQKYKSTYESSKNVSYGEPFLGGGHEVPQLPNMCRFINGRRHPFDAPPNVCMPTTPPSWATNYRPRRGVQLFVQMLFLRAQFSPCFFWRSMLRFVRK